MPADKKSFVTPEDLAEDTMVQLDRLVIATCNSAAEFAVKVTECYRKKLSERGSRGSFTFLHGIEDSFSDSETRVRLDEHIGGADVFLLQQLLDPRSGSTVNQNYLSFLIAARGFREHGAARITAVLPYLAYARQDKPTKYTREPTTAQLMAELSLTAGVDTLIAWAPHSSQIHGFYGSAPIHLLDSENLFLREFSAFGGKPEVIVTAPDAGAAKLATHFSRELELSCAVASKYRPSPENVEISDVIGDFSGKRTAIILDDMIASGGTIYELARKLVREKGIEELYVGVGHNLCRPQALDRLSELHSQGPLIELVTTDSVPQTDEFRSLPFIKIRSLAEIFCLTINRVHYDRSVSELFFRD